MIDRQTANDVGIPSYIPQYTNTSIYFSSKLTCHQANKPINVLNTISMLSECRHRSVPVSCVLCATVVRCATRSFLPSSCSCVRPAHTDVCILTSMYPTTRTHSIRSLASSMLLPQSPQRIGERRRTPTTLLQTDYCERDVDGWLLHAPVPPLPACHSSPPPPFISSQGSRLHPVSRA